MPGAALSCTPEAARPGTCGEEAAPSSRNFLESRCFAGKLGPGEKHRTRAVGAWGQDVRAPPTIKKKRLKKEGDSDPINIAPIVSGTWSSVIILAVTTDPEGATVPI